MAKIRNFNPHNSEILSEGSYFQIISPDLNPIKIKLVSELSITTRNIGSFGSTDNATNINLGTDMNKFTLFFDGCCKGNPGKGGAGAVIYDGDNLLWSKSIYLNTTTNNKAEYNALIIGLEEASRLNIKKIIIKGDSKLIIDQVKDIYKVKSPELKILYNTVKNLIKNFDSIELIHIKRSFNKIADKLANNAILNNI